jgi:hypothetical protein
VAWELVDVLYEENALIDEGAVKRSFCGETHRVVYVRSVALLPVEGNQMDLSHGVDAAYPALQTPAMLREQRQHNLLVRLEALNALAIDIGDHGDQHHAHSSRPSSPAPSTGPTLLGD